MKKNKALLSFLLSFLMCFTFLPTTVEAAPSVNYNHIILNISNDNGDYASTNGDYLPLSVTTSKYTQKDLTFAQLIFKLSSDIPADSIIDFEIVFNNGNPFRITDFRYVDFNAGYNYSADYTYNADIGTLKGSFEIDNSITNDDVVAFTMGISSSTNSNANAWFKVSSMTISYTSAEKSFRQKLNAMFSDLFGWLKDIRDNISNFGTDVGKWFSNLSSNISS